MNTSCVFIGRSEIGLECLKVILKHRLDLKLVLVEPDGRTNCAAEMCRLALNTYVPSSVASAHIPYAAWEDPKKQTLPECEVVFHCGGTKIIPASLLSIPRLGILNLHPALLPKYRGRLSNVWALFNGETEHGVTLHWMTEKMDAGPIIEKCSYGIMEWDTGETLWGSFTRHGAKLLDRAIGFWTGYGRITYGTDQDESEATYCPKGLPNNGIIDPSWDEEKAARLARALHFPPFPGAKYRVVAGMTERIVSW